jgi:hypothetical protein
MLLQEQKRCFRIPQTRNLSVLGFSSVSPGIKTKPNNDLVKIKSSKWVNPIAILGLKETFRNDKSIRILCQMG